MNFTELLGSIVFEYPEHLSDVAFWHGHVPFAFWCVEVVQPGIFVELGTHKGDSYCAFCQAVHKLGLPAACYAVDTWQGDQHVGVYGEEVYETLQRYHDERYGAFSRLVRSTFDEAIEYFADGSIDLLHIDGVHTYESVQHDFETWLPKLSGRAVVLLHDINVRQRDFGTWRFWEELCERYPHFSFLHSHGLGVLAVGQKPAPAIERLCSSSYEEIEEVRSIFARLGHTVSLTSERDALAWHAARLESILTERDQVLGHLQTTLQEHEAALANKGTVLAERDQVLGHLQTTLQDHEAALVHKDALLTERDQALDHLQTTLHKHETALAQRNDDLTAQRVALEDQARLIAAYEAEHGTFGAQVGRWLSRQRNVWAPPTSPQGKILGRMIRAARVLYRQGVMPLVRRAIYSGLHRVRPQRWPAMDWLHTSGLFDAVYYLSTYPDVGALRMDPAKHYMRFGWKEGRNPHALFDTAFYLAHNPDVAQAGVNPLWHYVTCGWQEGRNPHALFDTAFYLAHNPDVAQAGVNPLWHYATCGRQEGRAPQAPFDTAFYLEGEYEPEAFPGLGETSVKLIAFYLPQFHPIPENDRWWGKGFTEWTNVSKARPLFPGHYQPHLPGELGFYDLRLLEVMQRQIELAKQYGLYGFCFYLYWFHGKRLLERPVEQFLAHPELDFPFCLCWANENWTRRWDGYDQEILIAQDYSLDDDLTFIRDVEPYLRDPRYIRVNGKPLLLVYNPGMLPDAQATVSRWREYCRSAGIGDLCVAMAQTFGMTDPRPFGFDAAVEFPPLAPHIAARLRNITPAMKFSEPDFVGAVYSYADVVRDYALEPMEYVLFKGVMPGWDNTARRDKRATVFANSSPQAFQTWLETAIQWTVQHHAPTQRLVFINAWNEWAEGTHLEPDRKYGYAYLNATARALQKAITKTRVPKKHTMLFLSHDAVRAGAQVLVLDLLGWVKDRTAIQPKILLGAGGALEHAFREIADVLILDDLLAQTQNQSDIEARLKAFCGPDVKLIYASTVVSGKYLEHLAFLKIPVVTHVHELQKSIEKFAGQQTMDKLLRYTQHYIVGSPAVRENLRTTYRIEPEKMEVVYDFSGKKAFYPSDEEKVERRATLRLDPRKTLIFGCGFFQWRKGPDLFVAVAEQLVKMGLRDFHCYWIGERDTGEYVDLDGHILECGLTEYVTFLGGKDNLRAYFIAGDIFILPSREDTFPLVCLEAAACGLPIICFADAGGMPDFVEQDAGFVVAYENIAQMADKLALLITDETLRQTLGNRAREKFLARHTLDRTAPAVLKSMQKVAGIAPAMSVIVPVYNHAPFLRQRLESILQQTFQDLEVILLDDGSTDGSITILQEYASRPNVRLEVNTHNRGVFAQWLKGLDLAAADLIWIAEDDDFCDPDFLATLVPFFDDPDTRLAYCNSHAVDAEGNVTRDLYLHHYYHNLPVHKWRQDYINTGTTEVNHGLAIKNTIPNVSAVVFRKPGDLATIMPEILTLRCAGDWLLYLHLLKQGKIGYSARGLNYHRRHPDSVVFRNATAAERTIPDYYRVHQYVLQHYDIAPDVFEGMVRFMEQELRLLFPELSDEMFRKLYDSQALRRLYTPDLATR